MTRPTLFHSNFKPSLDIASKIMTGDNSELEDPLFRGMLRAGHLAGEIYAAKDSNGKILSFALWFIPGQSLWDRCVSLILLFASAPHLL